MYVSQEAGCSSQTIPFNYERILRILAAMTKSWLDAMQAAKDVILLA